MSSVIDKPTIKKINDTYGHIAGDKILQSVAQFLQQHVLLKCSLPERISLYTKQK